jgi:predicted acylesterase/phospholipase RssA
MPNDLQHIGRAGQPVRAVSFAGGGFDTAMQLGLVHALMVIQGKAPEVVVGVSTGAVNATALAEVLQAGDELERGREWKDRSGDERRELQRRRLEARVARFREVLETCVRLREELPQALFPDTFQIGAQRPLRPLDLPIHSQAERDERRAALRAKAGLITLYNELLDLRLPIGTIAQGVRLWLGFQATGNIRRRGTRTLARAMEIARAWLLAGANLQRLAPLVAMLAQAVSAPREEGGATAGQLISRVRWFRRWHTAARHAVWTGVLVLAWTVVTAAVVAAPFALVRGAHLVARAVALTLSWGAVDWVERQFAGRSGWAIAGLYLFVALWAAIAVARDSAAWRRLLSFRGDEVIRQLVGALAGALDLARLLAIWAVVGSVTVAALTYLAGALRLLAGRPVLWLDLLDSWIYKPGGTLELLFWRTLLALGAAYLAVRWLGPRDYFEMLCRRYGIADGVLAPHALRQVFVRLFDERYYGERPIGEVVEHALQGTHPERAAAVKKCVRDYADPLRHAEPVHVGIAAADLETGTLAVVPESAPVVDALEAATAMVPAFPVKRLVDENGNERVYLDGTHVANEPTRALMDYLRDERHPVHPNAGAIHVWAVAPLPFSKKSLGGALAEYRDLTDVAGRALELQRFRDAVLERRLTHVFTRAIAETGNPGAVFHGAEKDYLRAYVVPVEPVEPLRLNSRLFAAEPSKARGLISEAVADGCRASLELMVRQTMPGDVGGTIGCRAAVRQHLTRRLGAVAALVPDALPGSVADGGPGLAEVCEACRIRTLRTLGAARAAGAVIAPQSLEVRALASERPEGGDALLAGLAWPHEREDARETPALVEFVAAEEDEEDRRYHERRLAALKAFAEPAVRVTAAEGERSRGCWPRQPTRLPVFQGGRPLVSLLLSGGVFRGVYQVGVLNALSELGIVPDIVAGASVGSIMGAMSAQVLGERTLSARRARMASLAATFLALDRLILTDRFADFVRNFTLRAAECRFSVRHADRVFRRFDDAGPNRFEWELRLVVAGLERLFYVSPYELNALVRAFRHRRTDRVLLLLRRYVQELLDRAGVGREVLGAEPLAELIAQHVLEPLGASDSAAAKAVPFDAFLDPSGILLLATATNLTRGRLEIFGEHQRIGTPHSATLLEGLLASSAFPGVFRPRWSWEVFPGSAALHQYIDGGVMDNLPLDAVVEFLDDAAGAGLVERRPRFAADGGVPHLLLAASLEPAIPSLEGPRDVAHLARFWPRVSGRAAKLQYNKKLDIYAGAQRAVRDILTTAKVEHSALLDLEVVPVKPEWLCSTFGFHPMLGFRRSRQAASIAHGCATTLLALARVERQENGRGSLWTASWGIRLGSLPETVPDEGVPLELVAPREPGHCWLRPGELCPFSGEGLGRDVVPPATRSQVEAIYLACVGAAGERESERAADAGPRSDLDARY